MELQGRTLVIISREELNIFKSTQQEILQLLKNLQKDAGAPMAGNITAKEFMDTVRIKRTKFDEMVKSSQIKIIKKKRKIYVPVSEIERYFSDPKT